MGFPTKVHLITRKASEQWCTNSPSAIAQAMGFSRGESVEWIFETKPRSPCAVCSPDFECLPAFD
jgi:hypothetical protein